MGVLKRCRGAWGALGRRTFATMYVNKADALVDEELKISFSELNPRKDYTITTLMHDEQNVRWRSVNHFQPNTDGTIDLMRDSPLSGSSYSIVDNMGIFWSMAHIEPTRKIPLLRKNDVTTPFKFQISCCEKGSNKPLCTQTIQRWYSRTSTRTPVRSGKIRGTLFTPPGAGPFSAVIDLVGAEGGLHEFRAAMLSEHGFIVLALALFDHDDLPKDYRDGLDLDYVDEAIDYMQLLPNVRLGVSFVANSIGATIALHMSRNFDVNAICAISPCSFFHFPVMHKGAPVPHRKPDMSKAVNTRDGLAMKYVFWEGNFLGDLSCRLDIEKIRGALIMFTPDDDQHMPTNDSAELIWDTLEAAGHRQEHHHYSYQGSGHLLEPPHMPVCRSSWFESIGGNMLWGGERHCHAYAQRHMWIQVIDFIEKNAYVVTKYK